MRLGPCFLGLAILVLGCGDDGMGSGGTDGVGKQLDNGQGPCDKADDCKGDVCVALIDGDNPPVYCTQQCGGGCPDGFYCDQSTFALAGLEFCRLGDPPAAGEPPPSEEPPRLPCSEDADCEGGQVCATYMGERGCTPPCAVEADCTPPAFGGITFDLATCGADETPDQMRTVCLPDPKCYPNVQGCISGFP